jgi:PRC-barrel domain
MANTPEVHVGSEIYAANGERIGRIADLISDPITLTPKWYVVKTGRLTHRLHLVPYDQTRAGEHGAVVPYDKERVTAAPELQGPSPTEAEERELNQYYSSARAS